MRLNDLSEALGDEFGPDDALPDVDNFSDPTEGSIYAEVPQRRWEPALKSSLMWTVRRITGLIKEKFGLDVVFNEKELGIDRKSGELVFGWRVMDLRSDQDRVKLKEVREWLATDDAVLEALNLEDFILEPDWKIYES